ncbi:MAG: serine/threonine-protein kinase [Chitinophagaceae bacterium]
MANENIIGENVYGYQVTAKLGSGGMGDVYRATDNTLGREVALKMLHPYLTKDSLFLDRFKKEARVLAKLVHPNIAVIYNFLEQNGNFVMVMEYVDGDNLDDLLRKHGVLPIQLLVPIFVQALEGLQHAHKKEILHRDIKPANIMLTSEGNLKLMDFGIAKIANEQRLTQVNKIVGTIEYMAPELIEGKDASIASDLYAMGITLYELVSGNPPFENETDYNLMQAILKNKPVVPDKINPSVPATLSEIILKSIEKNPADRYADARSFQQALLKAFPGYRDIDLSILPTQMPATKVIDIAQTQMASVLETKLADVGTSSNTGFVPAGKKFVVKNKVPLMIASGGVLIFILFLFLMNNHPDNTNDVAKNNRPVVDKPVTANRDSIARSNVQTIDNTNRRSGFYWY